MGLREILYRELKACMIAFATMSILPVYKIIKIDSEDYKKYSSHAAKYFSYLGLVLACILLFLNKIAELVYYQISPFFPGLDFLSDSLNSLFSGLALLILLACLSRFMHLDALADVIDAWGSSFDIGRRQAVLKDPHVGSFAASSLFFCLMLYLLLFAALHYQEKEIFLLWALVFSRFISYCCTLSKEKAIHEGLGSSFITTLRPTAFCISLIPLLLGFFSISFKLSLVPLMLFLFIQLLVFFLSFLLFKKLCRVIGGLNGDILGTILTVSEILCLFTVVLM